MGLNQSKIAEYYDKSCRNADSGWKAALWHSEDDQYYRFAMMNQLIDWKGCSILDIGCGQGDFYQFIRERSNVINYSGIDISHEMISAAKQRFPKADFSHVDFLAESYQPEQFDFVFGIGTFTFKLGDYHTQMDYIRQSIKKIFGIAKKGVGITLSSSRAAVKLEFKEVYYYYDPSEILDICLDITPSVIMNHLSLPLEMVVLLQKEENLTSP